MAEDVRGTSSPLQWVHLPEARCRLKEEGGCRIKSGMTEGGAGSLNRHPGLDPGSTFLEAAR
ncbi:MAG TPA: hypothetical protein VEW26_09035, partial [Allosphingosinicella sp.]|nr:hypothetical protein [Allosphingosinicella sp.]